MGDYLDDALIKASFSLIDILFFLTKAAIFLGILTLPLFYGLLWLLRGWFWGREELASGPVEGERRSIFRRIFALLLAFGVPIASIGLSVFLLG